MWVVGAAVAVFVAVGAGVLVVVDGAGVLFADGVEPPPLGVGVGLGDGVEEIPST
jgi:hypothetical protein